MSYEFYKQKIPRTHQFPLQRSNLDAALAAAGVEQLATVLFNSRPTWVPEQLLVVAHYTSEGITQGYAPPDSFGFWSYHPGTTSVVVYAVPKSESLLSARLLEEQGLQRYRRVMSPGYGTCAKRLKKQLKYTAVRDRSLINDEMRTPAVVSNRCARTIHPRTR